MASQQDIKRRITSVRNTRKVTKAMELVSGAKLRRAQLRIEALRAYAEEMQGLLAEVGGRASATNEPLLERREVETVAILVVTADRGLAGAFNSSVIRRSLDEAALLEAEGKRIVWLAVGKRAAGTLRFRGKTVQRAWTGFSAQPEYANAVDVAQALIGLYTERSVDRVLIVANAFKSALTQVVTVDELLPVPIPAAQEREAGAAVEGLLLFEPAPEEMLGTLLPKALETQVYRAFLESAASEHGARMTAMRNASENAQEMIGGLTLQMNRARQSEITQQILEVVAGADALTG